MLKSVFLLLVILINTASLATEQAKYVVAYNETTAPMLPLVKLVYEEMGLFPKFILVPSERAILNTNSGVYDADLSRVGVGLEKYPNLVLTKESLKKTELYAYVKKGSKISLKTIADVKTHTVGMVLGSKLPEVFANNLGIQVEKATTVDNFYSMLDHGRFEIALITDTQLLSQLEKINKIGMRIGPVLYTTHSYHVLNKKHSDLIPKFDLALKKIKSDGRFEKLMHSTLYNVTLLEKLSFSVKQEIIENHH